MSTLPSHVLAARVGLANRTRVESSERAVVHSSQPIDEPLLPRVAFGDSAAIDECVSRYGGLIWSLARRMFANRVEAEDAVQEVFIQLWRKAALFDPGKASESTFVGVLARRRLIDLLRRKKSGPTIEAVESIDVATAPVDHLEEADELNQLKQLWAELVPDQQQVLSLSIYNGLSYPQIAEQLSIPVGTVKTRARLGLKTLREKAALRSGGRTSPGFTNDAPQTRSKSQREE